MEDLKVGICIHGMSNVDFQTYANHLACLAVWSHQFDCSLVTCGNTKVAQARNEILEKAEQMGVEYLFFLDTDHRVDPTCLQMLMQHMKVGVAMASGVVCRRRDTYNQIGYVYKDERWYPVDLPLNGLSYEVSTCAFGCNVFRLKDALMIEKPVFQDSMSRRKDGSLFSLRSDVRFCRELQKVTGKRIVIDTRVLVGHVTDPLVVWPQDSNILKGLVNSGTLRF